MRVGGGLGGVDQGGTIRVGRRAAGLEVDDGLVLHEIEHADQRGQPVAGKVGFDADLHGIGLPGLADGRLAEEGFQEPPADLLLFGFDARAYPKRRVHRCWLGHTRPVSGVEISERTGLLPPACAVPALRMAWTAAPTWSAAAFGFLQAQHVPEEELQPARLEERSAWTD